MIKKRLKVFFPHFIALIIFIIVTGIYFYPQLLGLKLRQGDTEQAIGMSKEISDFRAKFHKEPLWTNAAFSGMPTYQISTVHPNYVASLEDALILKPVSRPIAYIFLAMIAFYILLVCFDLGPWLSIIGAVAFGFSSIFMLYLGAGHNSKVHAIALLPALIGSLLLAYRKNYKPGAVFLSFFVCLEVAANHLQMTYYSLFLIFSIVIVEFVRYYKNKELLRYLKISAILVVAAILGILPSFSNIYTTYEYSKLSTRGKSELTISPSSSTKPSQTANDALEIGYITEYCMGFGEAWSVAIPDVKGGVESYLGSKKDVMETVDSQYKEYIARQPSYWGEQDSSGGAFYFGVTVFVLFILGLIFITDPIKWAFLAASVLGVVLSWKYGIILEFFINHFPWFNKFRDTKMMMILVQISFPFIGMLFVKELFTRVINKRRLIYALLAINGLLFLFYVTPSTFFDFVNFPESNYFNKQISANAGNPEFHNQFNIFISGIEHARIVIFKKDTLRSLIFSLLVSGLVYFFAAGKVKRSYFIGVLAILVLSDLWMVDKRYLNNEETATGYKMWVKKQRYNNPYRASQADNFILNNEVIHNPSLRNKIDAEITQGLVTIKDQDTDIEKERLSFEALNFATDYRVLTLHAPFSNGAVSYFHKSVGGYNGAKLKKYQELIDFYVSNEINTIIKALQDSAVTKNSIAEIFHSQVPVLNMLNTKYIIYNPQDSPIINPSVNGNCWLVKDVVFVKNANEEVLSLGKVNLKQMAVVNKNFKDEVTPFSFDSTASIKLVSVLPNQLIYSSQTQSPQLAVFSEIFYPKGWNVYLDGKKSEYICANYLLRAMSLPGGQHNIEFRFEPRSFVWGERISIAGSLLLICLISTFIAIEGRKMLSK